MTIWNRSIHKNKKKDLLKNQRFVFMEAYLNSHSVGWIDLLAYKCILMDCSENLTSCFLTFLKSDTALLIGRRKAMNHSLENLQMHSLKTSCAIEEQEDSADWWVPGWPQVLPRGWQRWRDRRCYVEESREHLASSFGFFTLLFLNECLSLSKQDSSFLSFIYLTGTQHSAVSHLQ